MTVNILRKTVDQRWTKKLFAVCWHKQVWQEANYSSSEKTERCFFGWSKSQQQDHNSRSQVNLLLHNGFAERR